MPPMDTFSILQANQNAKFGYNQVSPQSVFDAPSAENRIFDAFSDVLQNEGSDKNRDFSRQFGNGDGMKSPTW